MRRLWNVFTLTALATCASSQVATAQTPQDQSEVRKTITVQTADDSNQKSADQKNERTEARSETIVIDVDGPQNEAVLKDVNEQLRKTDLSESIRQMILDVVTKSLQANKQSKSAADAVNRMVLEFRKKETEKDGKKQPSEVELKALNRVFRLNRDGVFEEVTGSGRNMLDSIQLNKDLEAKVIERRKLQAAIDKMKESGIDSSMIERLKKSVDQGFLNWGDATDGTTGAKFVIGVACKTVEKSENGQTSSTLIVDSVLDDSPAATAGLKEGDVLLKAGDKSLSSVKELIAEVQSAGENGKSIRFTFSRGDEEKILEIKPTARPESIQFQKSQVQGILDGILEKGFQVQPGIVMPKDSMRKDLGWTQISPNLPGIPGNQSQEVADLKSEIKELKSELNEIKSMLKELSNRK